LFITTQKVYHGTLGYAEKKVHSVTYISNEAIKEFSWISSPLLKIPLNLALQCAKRKILYKYCNFQHEKESNQ